MSDNEKQLQQALEDFKNTILKSTLITDGIISNVRESDVLCDVTISGNLYSNVPFKVLVKKSPSIIEVPAEGSACLVCMRNANFTTPQILFIQDVEKLLVVIGNTTYQVTKDGFILTNGSSGLKNTFKNIINELIGFKTISPGGNGLTDPTTIVNLQKYLADLDNYLID